jgi:hypothetical protein
MILQQILQNSVLKLSGNALEVCAMMNIADIQIR